MGMDTFIDKPMVLADLAARRRTFELPWQWAALGAILLASCGHLLIKVGLTAAPQTATSTETIARIFHYLMQPAVTGGLAVYGAGTALWISAVSRRNISFLYPLTALNYVIVSAAGSLLFGEHLSHGRWLGIGLVVLGVALLQFSVNGEKP